MAFKGFLLDKDGTLFDTERLYMNSWKEIAAERGFVLDMKGLDRMRGKGGDALARAAEELLPGLDSQEIMMAVFRRAEEKMKTELRLMPGARELLVWLKSNGFKTAVASSAIRRQIEENLQLCGITELIDALVSAQDVSHGKPDPETFRKAAELLGLQPEECYAAEDSMNGLISAHTAGCYTFFVPDLNPPTEELKPYYDELQPSLLEVLKKLQEEK